MKLGLHVSSSGGVDKAPERAATEAGQALQLFAGSPRTWSAPEYNGQQGEQFQGAAKKHGIDESFIHVMYLTSYATNDEEHRRKSVNAFITALNNCDTLGAQGAITHLGSHRGDGFETALPRIQDCLNQVLEVDHKADVILENSAGAGNLVGGSFEELAEIIAACDHHPRLKVCLDTAHMFTAGYDIREPGQWQEALDIFDETIGLERLRVLHLNDSKAEFNSFKDRHENIGDGYIGLDAFAPIVNDPRLTNLSGILEVPGINNAGPDQANIERLRQLKS